MTFGRLAEVTEKYITRGDRVGVIGTLDQQRWENEEGLTRSSFQLIVNSLEFIKISKKDIEENSDNDDIPF